MLAQFYTFDCVYYNISACNRMADSHQAKAGAKTKKIKEQALKIKEIFFAFTSVFAWCIRPFTFFRFFQLRTGGGWRPLSRTRRSSRRCGHGVSRSWRCTGCCVRSPLTASSSPSPCSSLTRASTNAPSTSRTTLLATLFRTKPYFRKVSLLFF